MTTEAYYVPPHGKHFDGYPNCYRWTRTFAWLPKKTISNNIVWLRRIYKQRFYTALGPPIGQSFHMEPFVEYGELFDILKEDHGQE